MKPDSDCGNIVGSLDDDLVELDHKPETTAALG